MTLRALVGCLAAVAIHASADEVVLQGHVGVHDPSTVVREGDVWRIFATGWGVRCLESRDLVNWTTGSPVFPRGQTPDWATDYAPGFRGRCWAPDLIHTGDEYRLYYSVSRFGKQTSAIGLAATPTLDPDAPEYRWQDRGVVVSSSEGDPFNAIDPSILIDDDGRHWMAFGSYWDGIFLIELGPDSGVPLAGAEPSRLAWAEMIEAPTLLKHGGHYYLFVNHGLCCRGVDSTYRVLVGRSESVSGPYVDRDGMALTEGGGTPVLGSQGQRVGPGHIALFEDVEEARFGFHYYDGADGGRSKLALARWEWTPDGWPRAVDVQLSGKNTAPRYRRSRPSRPGSSALKEATIDSSSKASL